MPQYYKLIALHCFIFISCLFLGAANIITDLAIELSNPAPSINVFSVEDFLNSKASGYIAQYLAVAALLFVLSITTFITLASTLTSKLKASSSWLIHFITAIIGYLFILELNSFFFSDSRFIAVLNLQNSILISTGLIAIMAWMIWITVRRLQAKTVVVSILTIAIINIPWSSSDTIESNKPNIFLISIDSLRPELISTYMPFLQSQLDQSIQYKNSFTTLARTYPSWMSLLTGTHPSINGAQFNLQDESQLNESNQYLPKILLKQGYHTIYASDEQRFSNLGSAQGFVDVIGPRTGASDFILGNYADFPLTNLLTLLPFAKWVLPELYANRAAGHLYHPSAFNNLLTNTIKQLPAKPVLLATHFCLPHWPYTFIGAKEHDEYPDKPFYPSNLVAVDNQIKQLYLELESSGRLNNSRIIFLSDHGESWGNVNTKLTLNNAPLMVNDHGHGMNILSSTSHKVLLALKGFEQLDMDRHRLTSLMDITPTLLKELNLPAIKTTGQALQFPAEQAIEISFESGVVLAVANQANPDPKQVAQAGAYRFRLNEDGRLRLKTEEIPSMLSKKQLGLRIDELGLFKMTHSEPYLLIDYSSLTAKEIPALTSAPKTLANRFCELYSSLNASIKIECDTL